MGKDKKARKEVKFKPAKIGLKDRLFKKLYADEARGLYLLVTFLPFFSGSWIAGGLVLDKIIPFVVATLVLIGTNFGETILFDKKIVFKKEFLLIFAAANVALLFIFYNLTNIISATLLLGISVLIFLLEAQLKNSSPRIIILKNIALIFRMSIYSYIGIMTQRYNHQPVFLHMVFGYVPACILAGSLITKYSQVFLNNAWKKSVSFKNKKEQEISRPGSLSRLVSVFLVIGPAVPLLLTPFDHFPTPFLAIALIFSPIIKTLESYFKSEKPDAVLAVDQANIALLMSVLLLGIGILIRLGIT